MSDDKKQIDDNELNEVNGGMKIFNRHLIEKMKELVEKIKEQLNNKK